MPRKRKGVRVEEVLGRALAAVEDVRARGEGWYSSNFFRLLFRSSNAFLELRKSRRKKSELYHGICGAVRLDGQQRSRDVLFWARG